MQVTLHGAYPLFSIFGMEVWLLFFALWAWSLSTCPISNLSVFPDSLVLHLTLQHVNAGSFQSLESEDLASNTNSIAFVRESRYNTAQELTIPVDFATYASYTPLSPPCDFTMTVQICYSTGSWIPEYHCEIPIYKLHWYIKCSFRCEKFQSKS